MVAQAPALAPGRKVVFQDAQMKTLISRMVSFNFVLIGAWVQGSILPWNVFGLVLFMVVFFLGYLAVLYMERIKR